MFVKKIMLKKEKLMIISPKENLKKALQIIEANNYLSIPVSEGEKFYGAISKDKIYEFYFDKLTNGQCVLAEYNVEDVMRTDIPTVHHLEQMEKAAYALETKNVPFVAVIDDNEVFKGIVTHNAIFHEFTELLGLNKGRRLAVIAYDIPGQISKLSKIISEHDGDIISFVVIEPESVMDVKEIVIRLKTDNFQIILEKVRDAGFKIQ